MSRITADVFALNYITVKEFSAYTSPSYINILFIIGGGGLVANLNACWLVTVGDKQLKHYSIKVTRLSSA